MLSDHALLLVNTASKEQRVTVQLSDFFIDEVKVVLIAVSQGADSYRAQALSYATVAWDAKDLWDVNSSQAGLQGSLTTTIAKHGAKMYRLSKANQDNRRYVDDPRIRPLGLTFASVSGIASFSSQVRSCICRDYALPDIGLFLARLVPTTLDERLI